MTNPKDAVAEFRAVSKWYGNVIGVNHLTFRLPPGVTGLLGPNGAGKSTVLQLATGQLRPSQGEILVLGRPAWGDTSLNREIGLCPEQDAFYEWMSGREFVSFCARLGGFPRRDARDRADRAIEQVGMTGARDRAIRGYSKGMRQRIKIAQTLVHDPKVIFLDEPMTGTDPVARRDLMDIVLRLGGEGTTILLSSHVLHEVQSVTPNIVLLNRGRLVAEGDVRQIRDLIDTHPHRIILTSPEPRALASKLVRFADVVGVDLGRDSGSVLVETRAPDRFYARLPGLALDGDTPILGVASDDDNLEAVFKYLVNS
jgi:ABC-2 type transport system ATP-binding protein